MVTTIDGLDKPKSGKALIEAVGKENLQSKAPYQWRIPKVDWPECGLRGKVLDTSTNLKYLLDYFDINVRYNKMSRQREIIVPSIKFLTDEAGNASYEFIDNICILNELKMRRLHEKLNDIAWSNAYHPIAEAILNKPWDGVPRLDLFINTITSSNPQLAYTILRTWLTAAVAAAFSDTGFANQGVLVLQGPQYTGKTSFAKAMDFLGCRAVREGMCLDPRYKDDIIGAARHWIVEIGELDSTLRKADIARLKSYITNQIDIVRSPYAPIESALYRRTAFIATVNEANFLVDNTGNRRWWTISIIGINLNHGLDMQQVFAEVYHDWQNGAPTQLTTEIQEQVNRSNEDFEQANPLEEQIRTFYNWDHPGRQSRTASQILEDLKLPITKSSTTIIGQIMKKITGKDPERINNVKYHKVPFMYK